ncbi:sigma-70 family RNA polymerase sigma factor [Streptomyces sp. MH13]|uniref:sigma-70 family RNA polymerase sigma factor n=1 Tax=Streptomyces sp. MH13 TaxID=3417651 RepID=UPI003CE86965
MTQPVAAGNGPSGLREAVAELLVRLRRAAVDGVVPELVFDENVRTLALGDGERERLRHELARLGLPVRDLHVHTEGDSRDREKVAHDRGENVIPRLGPARNLLARYADADGYVTSRALDGVVRLAGLDAREAAQLREGTLVRGPEGAPGEVPSSGDEQGESIPSGTSPDADVSADPDPQDTQDTQEPQEPGDGLAVDAAPADLAEALAAAHAVLEVDRREGRPGSRLLSAQAEVGLALMVRGGVEGIAREPDEEELKALPPDDLRIRARDCLVVHNQRLVRSLVRPYLEQGLDYDDLLQHGLLGLLRAARKFDPTKGFKFSTYATWWIRQSITRAIADEGALIRIPVHMHEQMRKVARAERALAAEGRYASAADVAVRCDMTLQKVEEIRRLTRRTDSLDRVIGDGATLADFVAETHLLPSVDTQVIGALHVAELLSVVDTFTEREARILVRRLGLDGDEPSTLDDLGREFGVTRERIRQIEAKVRPVLRERVRTAGLVGLDAVCEKAERAAEQAAEARRAERFARATHAARTVRARLALRKARAERLARATWEQEQEQLAAASVQTAVAGEREDNGDAPIADAVAEPAGTDISEESALDGAVADAGEAVCTGASNVVAADWEHARRLARAPVDQISWLAEYTRTAVGDAGLAALLGQPATDAVARYVRDGAPLPRPVLTALEVLRRVFDAVSVAERRPEDFLDRPAEALRGATPRAYLGDSPLVNGESRLAVRDALREFLAAATPGAEPETLTEGREAEQKTEGRAEDRADSRAEDRTEDQEQEQPEPEEEPQETERPAGTTPQTTADWDKARTLTQPPMGGGVAWLAEYALLALGHLQLSVLLGSSATDSVVRAARERGMLDRPVVEALDVLKEVFDTVKRRELRPEHFFERPVDALAGATPRAYLATKPLVRAASRLVVRDALREFVAAPPVRTEPASARASSDEGAGPSEGSTAGVQGEPSAPVSVEAAPVEQPPVVGAEEPPVVGAEELLAAARARHQAELALLAREHERRLSEVRGAADERVAAVRAEAERRLDALEAELLHRTDRALDRRVRHVRHQAEEHLAHLKEQHREAYAALLLRAERAEEAGLRTTAAEERAHELERRLYEYREGAEARIGELESRLRAAQAAAADRESAADERVAELETRLRTTEEAAAERERAAASAREEYRQGVRARVAEVEARLREAEAAVAQRDLFVEAARRSAEETEQQAAQRIAQSEHDAWLRITDLQSRLSTVQAELAAAQEAAAAQSRTSLRDRWRRS